MYHEEKVIDGVLHFRTSPNGEWEPHTAVTLTRRVVAAEARYRKLVEPAIDWEQRDGRRWMIPDQFYDGESLESAIDAQIAKDNERKLPRG
jgi:hypothetical protein